MIYNGLFMSPAWRLKQDHFLLTQDGYKDRLKHSRLSEFWFIQQAITGCQFDKALEFGAWDTDFWRMVQNQVNHLEVTDSFGWATRECAKEMVDREEWIHHIIAAGHSCYPLDVQELDKVEEYDLIYSVSVIEHVVDDRKALKNIHRALRSGGKFVFTTEVNLYTALPYQPDVFFRVYSLSSILSKLDEAGFQLDGHTIPEDREFDEKMKTASSFDLRQPYQSFAPMGFSVTKKDE